MLPMIRNNTTFATGPTNRLDSFFDRIFGDDGGFVNQGWPRVPVSVWEDDDHVWVEAELPGVSDEDLEIVVHNGTLFIRGERKPREGRRYLYDGRSYGRFERAIALPVAVNPDDVQATLNNGLLCIGLPKSPEAKPKKITLKTG